MTNYTATIISTMIESMKEAGVTDEQFKQIDKLFASKLAELNNE